MSIIIIIILLYEEHVSPKSTAVYVSLYYR